MSGRRLTTTLRGDGVGKIYILSLNSNRLKAFMQSNIYKSLKSTKIDALHIAVLAGGIGNEREVSLSSASKAIDTLHEMGYQVTGVDMGSDIALILTQLKPDMVFNCLHGMHGEDGCVPGMLEIMGIPYTHSGVLASACAMDKELSQMIFMNAGIKCPKRIFISMDDDLSIEPMPRPYVLKPISEGSSFGVEIVLESDDFNLSNYEFKYGNRMIMEQYIPGRELQVAILNNKAIGVLEIILKGARFYDYEAKYVEGFADHVFPAILTKDEENKIKRISEEVHRVIGARCISRVEFRFDGNDFYLLEINTHPGMTPLSIVPEIAAKTGIDFKNFLQILIDDAFTHEK